LLLDRWPLGGFRHLKELMQESILPLFRECSHEALLLISLAAGVGEELLFRGVAQLGIEQASGSTWLAVAIASVMFGLVHPITKTYALLAGLIGVYFGVLVVLTGNLLVPIVAHAAYDFVALVYLLSRREHDATTS
jgi:membrane protease YdiL (CAAX protease family)